MAFAMDLFKLQVENLLKLWFLSSEANQSLNETDKSKIWAEVSNWDPKPKPGAQIYAERGLKQIHVV